jgi:uncharacterized membrane protein (UPF0127 family)
MTLPLNLTVADSFLKRLKGLIGVNEIALNDALLIPDCKMVHTFAMQIPIGIFFIGSQGQILRCIPSLKPWRMAYHPYAKAVVETKCFDKKNISKHSHIVHKAYWLLNKF